jgi:hypothetical protein
MTHARKNSRLIGNIEVAAYLLEHHQELLEMMPEVRSIPIINDYIRGLSYLREAYEAYRDPDTPARGKKIAAGVFGGLVRLKSKLTKYKKPLKVFSKSWEMKFKNQSPISYF